jgi:hypothetical protein
VNIGVGVGVCGRLRWWAVGGGWWVASCGGWVVSSRL